MSHELLKEITGSLDDLKVWIVSEEDVINLKIAWIQQLHSEKQMEDIKLLMLSPGLDKEYLTHWCKILNLNTFGLL
jgi:hypothetical protein